VFKTELLWGLENKEQSEVKETKEPSQCFEPQQVAVERRVRELWAAGRSGCGGCAVSGPTLCSIKYQVPALIDH
jgi:hypothetical protein